MFRRHFCSGITFDLITLYSLLEISNDSSETIRTKGMKDQLCAIFLASVVAFLVAWRGNFPRFKKKMKLKFLFCCGNFKVHFLPFFTPTNYSSLISKENSDVELFHV